MPIEGEIVQPPSVVRKHLERLYAENDELRAKVKEQERENCGMSAF